MSVSPARAVALRVVRRTIDADAYANLTLAAERDRAGLSPADAALATELASGTLRRLGTLDAIIDVVSNRASSSLDAAVRDILRLGIYQLVFTRVPAHAAVDDAATQARTAVGERAVGFVNAVLRTVAAGESWVEQAAEAARSDDEALAIRTSHPVWIIRALRRALAATGDAGDLTAALEANNVAPAVDMVALPGLACVPVSAGVEPAALSPVGFTLERGDPAGLIAASAGGLRVQDEGSQLVALALSRARPLAPGERILDLCAGPGGKTALLAAEAARVGAMVEANEIASHRAGLVRAAVAPFGVVVHETDGRQFTRAHPGAFSRMLVDAPCTGLGALRRRPEARWRKRKEDIAELRAVQVDLLRGATDAVAPGGVVAYVTCSPHLGETVEIVREVLDGRRDLGLLDAPGILQRVATAPLDLSAAIDGLPVAQLWPHRHGTDAMFLALIERRE